MFHGATIKKRSKPKFFGFVFWIFFIFFRLKPYQPKKTVFFCVRVTDGDQKNHYNFGNEGFMEKRFKLCSYPKISKASLIVLWCLIHDCRFLWRYKSSRPVFSFFKEKYFISFYFLIQTIKNTLKH